MNRKNIFPVMLNYICIVGEEGGSLLDSAREIQTAKQMNGNQK